MLEKSGYTDMFLRSIPFFDGLDSAEQDRLLQAASVKRYPKHSQLFHQGDKAERFFVLIKGWLKLHNITAGGEDVIVGMLTGGDIVSAVSIVGGMNYPCSATVAEDMEAVEIPSAIIKERVERCPELAARMMEIINCKISALMRDNMLLTAMDARQRLSCLILRLSMNFLGSGGTLSLPYDKSIMAAQLGMNPATLSRTLGKLSELGVASRGSEIQIQSFAYLAELCCKNCPALDCKCLMRLVHCADCVKAA